MRRSRKARGVKRGLRSVFDRSRKAARRHQSLAANVLQTLLPPHNTRLRPPAMQSTHRGTCHPTNCAIRPSTLPPPLPPPLPALLPQPPQPHLEVCPAIAHTQGGQLLKQPRCGRLSPLAGVYAQNVAPGGQVGQREHQLSIKPGQGGAGQQGVGEGHATRCGAVEECKGQARQRRQESRAMDGRQGIEERD